MTLQPPSRKRRIKAHLGQLVLGGLLAFSAATLVFFLAFITYKGAPVLSWEFLSSFPSRFPERAGLQAAIVGTAWIGIASLVVALPVGIAAAIYLNEFAKDGPLKEVITTSILNLAGVPSVVFGILGLAIFARAFGLGPSIATAGLTLGLLTLPYIVIAAEEALKGVPSEAREAAFAMGATRWQVVRHHVIPYALPGMLTASILALSRAAGETAPLIVIGAAGYISFLPGGPLDSFTALPIQVYNWAQESRVAFHELAWGATFVLVGLTLLFNLAAILFRDVQERRYQW